MASNSYAGAHSSLAMPLIWRFFLASYSLFLYTLAAEVFSNSFLVKFRRGVELDEADDVARRNGFVNVGPVSMNRCFVEAALHSVDSFVYAFIRQFVLLRENCFNTSCGLLN